jgi:hypothetical protein
VRLLLDEMFPAAIAERLRDGHGHDVVAVCERPWLRGRPDDEVFAAAQEDGRAVVTENVSDYRLLGRQWEARGQIHQGLVFTTIRRYPRHQPRTIGRLVTALARLLDAEPEPAPPSNREIWL